MKVLKEKMEQATPFEMGLTEYQGETWQLMIALTSDPVTDVPEESSSHYGWTGLSVESEKWLFLNVEIGEGSTWSFGFDCNDSEALVFLRQLLRERRLMVGFPEPSRATRLEGVADKLVKELADGLEVYIPRWKNDFNKSYVSW